MTAPEQLVNGKTWAQRWAGVVAGTGCVCGQRHDTAEQESQPVTTGVLLQERQRGWRRGRRLVRERAFQALYQVCYLGVGEIVRLATHGP